MELRKNILKVLPLTCLLVLGGIGVSSPSTKVEEGSFDKFNNGPTLNVRKEGFIGSDEEVAYSDVYSQYGIDSENNYWVRFAVAVKGALSNLSFVREAVEELDETEGLEKEVKTVYKAVSSNGVATYYNPTTGLSTDEADAGNYYWACYSIKIANPDFYSSTISMSFKVDDEIVGAKKVSLNNLLGTENVYRFEAENAKITGNSGSGVNKDLGHTCFETSTYISPNFSGSICVRNSYHFVSTFDFDNSVKDDFAKVRLFMATRGEVALSTLYSIKVNSNDLDLSNIIVPATGNECVPGSEYFNMTEVLVPVSLVKGANSISISHGSGSYNANLDYIEVITSGEVTNWVDTPFVNNEDYSIEVSKMPTHRSEGEVKVTCTHEELGASHESTSYAIPSLADTNFYKFTKDEANALTNVEFNVSSKTLSFSYKNAYTLKISGATFEDGTTEKTFTVEEISSGEADKIVTNIPAGHKLSGYYDNKTKTLSSANFVMGYEDADIDLVYKPTEYVKTGDGHLDVGVGPSTFIDKITGIDANSFNARKDRIQGYIGNNRIGTIVSFNCTAATSQFRLMTGYAVEADVRYAEEYRITNLGSEAISFTLNQITTGTTKAGFEHKVTNLQPGETTTFTIEFSFGTPNTNVLALFDFSEQYSNASLGINASIRVL